MKLRFTNGKKTEQITVQTDQVVVIRRQTAIRRKHRPMKRTLFFGILIALLVTSGLSGQLTAQVQVTPVAAFTGPAVLDDWGNLFRSLGASVPENPQRTQVRTTIAQLACQGTQLRAMSI